MKKKTFQQPEMEVVEIDQADIICTSTQADVTIYGGSGILIDQENW